MKLVKPLAALATFAGSSVVASAPVLAQSYDYYTYSAASDAAASSFFGIGLLFSCCVPLIGLIIQAVLAFVVYKDAKKNAIENEVIWAILTFFLPLIGILVYFFAIKPDALKKKSSPVASAVEPKEEKK